MFLKCRSSSYGFNKLVIKFKMNAKIKNKNYFS